MQADRKKITALLKERRKNGGGITGCEPNPPKLKFVEAQLDGVFGIAFDPERHVHTVQADEPGLTFHTVKGEDDQEVYFEVKDGALYALLSTTGMNLEIWRGLIVAGARTDAEIEDERTPAGKRARRK